MCALRILWHSNAPWNNSGYGKETALFVPRIASLGHEITISAPYSFGGNILEWQGFQVLPCARDSAGNDTIVANYEHFKSDLCITLADVFGLLKSATALRQLNIAHWFPVDCDPLGEHDLTVLREGRGIPVAMSRFGQRVLHDEGTDPLFVPHAVDTGIYYPGDPEPFRKTVPQIGPDTFVIGLCAMNRDINRKGLSEQLQAFARFHHRHPDSHLALHTAKNGNPGVNLQGLANRLGIGSAISYPDQYFYDLGLISEENLAAWYNGLDVLSLCSFGEGFGLPLIEAQACGIPVITTDASATNELCGAGWLVYGSDFWTNAHGSFWQRPDIADIDAAYEAAWESKRDGKLPKKEAADFGRLFDADAVLERYWVPVLNEIEKRIGCAE
jgi:glycosyltransferase involved in cell wall biosynthesis